MGDISISNEITIKGSKIVVEPLPKAEILGMIDDFELVEELGGGGFGVVFKARSRTSGKLYAVKSLPPEVRHSREEVENIRENFSIVHNLRHQNIAAALLLHEAKDVSYSYESIRQKLRVDSGDILLVMDYAPGKTLSSWRKGFADRRVPIDQALEIVRQVADALDAAHAERILHRDVKPSNIMIEVLADKRLRARVLDFGLAAEMRSSMGRVSREIRDTSGTRPYMAPEQWAGARQGPATDLYSLAVVFHEMISGEVPFESVFESGDPVLMQTTVLNRRASLPPSIPCRFRRALRKALSKDPKDRHSSCRAFVEALVKPAYDAPRCLAWFSVCVACVATAGMFVSLRQKERQQEQEAEKAHQELIQLLDHEKVENAKRDKQEAERKAKEDEQARKDLEAKQQAKERLQAELIEKAKRDKQEAERKAKEDEQTRKEIEAELIEKAKRDEQARKELEAERQAKESAQRRKALWERLEKGSVFDPEPPLRKEGTEKTIELPGGDRMKFVWCPPGRFLMGSPESEALRDSGEAQHVVYLSRGFWIGQYEVSRKEWKSVMGGAGFKLLSLVGADGDYPIDNISWQQASEFCRRLSRAVGRKIRLPTEAEWEYACRAGTTSPFSFGYSLNGDRACCAGGDSYGTSVAGANSYSTKCVGSYQRNPWNIYDMHGNVFEWCQDYYGEYLNGTGEAVDPSGPATGKTRVRRGGCWNYSPRQCRSAFRARNRPDKPDDMTGLRVCCDEL